MGDESEAGRLVGLVVLIFGDGIGVKRRTNGPCLRLVKSVNHFRWIKNMVIIQEYLLRSSMLLLRFPNSAGKK